SDNRSVWLSRFYEIGKEAVRPKPSGKLFAFVVPYRKDDYENAAHRSALLNILKRGGVETQGVKAFRLNGVAFPQGTTVIPIDQPYGMFAKALLERQVYPNLRDAEGHPVQPYDVTAHSLALLMDVQVIPIYTPVAFKWALQTSGFESVSGCSHPATSGLYRSSVPSMDEGWTHWVFEEQARSNGCFRYESITDRETKSSQLDKYRTIIIPDQEPTAILNGYKAGTMPPEYTGGLGKAGVKALREFVEQGGTLVCLNRASSFAIEQFKLPVRDVVAKVSEKEFFVPGSILRIELDTSNPIARRMPKESIAWVEDSPVFEIVRDNRGSSPTVKEGSEMSAANVTVIARYPADKNPLLSGWLLGENRIRGKAALVEVSLGKGRIMLFGFRPQYRGQSLATYPLF